MQKLIILMAVMLLPGFENAMAQQPTPLAVVQAQLDAYNRQDIDVFAEQFAEDVKLYQQIGDSVPTLTGRKALKQRYSELFAKYPANYCTLAGRMTEGNFVIDHEIISGREKPLRIFAIYEVIAGKISRCWFVRQ